MIHLDIPEYSEEFIDAYVRFMASRYIDKIDKNNFLKKVKRKYGPNFNSTFATEGIRLTEALTKEVLLREDRYNVLQKLPKEKLSDEFIKKLFGHPYKNLIKKIRQGNLENYKEFDWYKNFSSEVESFARQKIKKLRHFLNCVDTSYTSTDFLTCFRELILLSPGQMEHFVQSDSKLKEIDFKAIKELYDFSKEIEICGKKEKINTYMVRHFLSATSSTGLLVCPYCNRNYINSRDNKLGGEMDHFYNKSDFPMFAISLYNFIPTCSTCNRIKHDNSLKNNPFLLEKKVKFDFTKISGDSYRIQLKQIDENGILNDLDQDLKSDFCDILKLEEAYQMHSRDIQEMVNREQEYGREYRADLERMFTGNEAKISKEIDKIIYGNIVEMNDDQELVNVSLGKFKKEASETVKRWKGRV